jgi:hypothetical protein
LLPVRPANIEALCLFHSGILVQLMKSYVVAFSKSSDDLLIFHAFA